MVLLSTEAQLRLGMLAKLTTENVPRLQLKLEQIFLPFTFLALEVLGKQYKLNIKYVSSVHKLHETFICKFFALQFLIMLLCHSFQNLYYSHLLSRNIKIKIQEL
jgi:hypothetical protein